jgi:DNA topoisomerase-1
VLASVGHIMDLPKNDIGVELARRTFAPTLVVSPGKEKIVDRLKKLAEKSDTVYLAPDPDREGEAIAAHLAMQLEPVVGKRRIRRVTFNEITEKAVKEAFRHARDIDENLVDAQQTRRVLDRLVGYQISPLLWDKVRRGLSAGRVQTVALRLIVEREREINAFRPVEYWTIDADLTTGRAGENPFTVRYVGIDGEPARVPTVSGHALPDERLTREVVAAVEKAKWSVREVERKDRRKNPLAPFTTSRLQQDASRQLGFSVSRTMKVAQRLYEGMELGDQGATGLITYMRTDSPRVSDPALAAVRDYIGNRYGGDYLPDKPNLYRSGKSAQEAHEAIRPTALERDPESLARYLGKDELALYTLIFNRFVSSQMSPAVYDRTTVDIEAAGAVFRATGQVTRFDGFMRVYTEGQDERGIESDDDSESTLPAMAEGDSLKLLEFFPEQHFTQPPPRFTQATLIKELEEKGIGRPSTYAAIMTSILNREYVEEDESKRLRPTTLGRVVSDLLVKAFPDIIESGFTAQMESDLDHVEEGRENWVKTLRRFYDPFVKRLAEAGQKMPEVKRKGIPTGITCELDGAEMVIKWGRNGEFLACSNYPKCTNTKEFTRDEQGTVLIKESTAPATTDEVCEKCGRPMVRRRSRFGEFLGCSGYPECDGIKRLRAEPVNTGVKCPDCKEGDVLERRSRRGKIFYGCNRYPKCKFASWDKPLARPCPDCGSSYMVEKTTKRDGTRWLCPNKECGYAIAAPEPSAPPPAEPSRPAV